MTEVRNEIVLQDIRKRFGETIALDGCSLTIKPGEVHAIVGENGSGKSTLAKILSGVVLPDSGTLSVFGQVPQTPMQARRLGVATIFQEVLVAESLPVVDNIFAGSDSLWRRSRSRAIARSQSRDILQRFTGLDIDPDTLVRNLPLSVRQWIVIARALVAKPRMLILDESSAALDLDATARLHAEIRKLRDDGCCVVIVTHRIAELIRITDRATVLRDGSVVGQLIGSEITEASLIGLMSPKQSNTGSPQERFAAQRRFGGGPILSASAVSVAIGAKPLDFVMSEGEIVGVTGLDGQGQANFLRVAAGILPPFAGEVTAGPVGRSVRVATLNDAVNQGIAYVSGDRAREGIFPNLSVLENFSLAHYRRHFGEFGWIDWKPLKKAFAVERTKLAIRMGQSSNRITSLSGGNQQKVLIGRALARAPRIMVLDDPARGVDVATKRELYALLKDFAAAGGAVLYLSSEIEEFMGFADRVLIFRDGSLFRTLPGGELSEHALLAGMFGHADASAISFELEAAH
ncbi:sugar ABC transporter ATP-binding protein [Mesorhizobium opportunistum]|uniref:Sugar ABC transporter ATP-binding protein n=1 Tax=Mesorhizobium opportunistum TaxID=593909 RepID=A0ABV1YEP5_9HYPH